MRVNNMQKAIIAALLAGGAIIVPAPAAAQTIAATDGIAVKPIADARLRYEHVDQDGLLRDADVVTARLRAGVELSSGSWSLLAEGETTLAISKRYNSGLNGRTQFPIVAGLDAVNAEVTYHRFASDRLSIAYGSEWDAAISAKRGRWTATAKLADYRADRFATDTRKFWLQLDWAY